MRDPLKADNLERGALWIEGKPTWRNKTKAESVRQRRDFNAHSTSVYVEIDAAIDRIARIIAARPDDRLSRSDADGLHPVS